MAAKLLLAGDVGGTKTNLAIFALDAKTGRLELLRNKRYVSAEFESLNAIALRFLGKATKKFTRRASACPARAQQPRTAHEPQMGGRCAHAARRPRHREHPPAQRPRRERLRHHRARGDGFRHAAGRPQERLGQRCVVSPGTGLGEAGLFWDGHKYRVWAARAATPTSRRAPRSRPSCSRICRRASARERRAHRLRPGSHEHLRLPRDSAKFPQLPRSPRK